MARIFGLLWTLSPTAVLGTLRKAVTLQTAEAGEDPGNAEPSNNRKLVDRRGRTNRQRVQKKLVLHGQAIVQGWGHDVLLSGLDDEGTHQFRDLCRIRDADRAAVPEQSMTPG